MFHARWIIENQLTLGQALLMIFAVWAGFHLASKTSAKSILALALQGAGAGVIVGAMTGTLAVLMHFFKLRFMFISLNRDLQGMLTFDTNPNLRTHGARYRRRSVRYGRGPLLRGAAAGSAATGCRLCWVGFFALFQELIQLMIQYESWDPIRESMFTWDGLRAQGAIGIFIVITTIVTVWEAKREQFDAGFARLSPKLQRRLKASGVTIAVIVGLIVFPMVAGNFIGQVLLFIGLFILMGMGAQSRDWTCRSARSWFCRVLCRGCLYLRIAHRGQPLCDLSVGRVVP